MNKYPYRNKYKWNDPDFIKGNDYVANTISALTYSGQIKALLTPPEKCSPDRILYISYNNGTSYAEVPAHELELINK